MIKLIILQILFIIIYLKYHWLIAVDIVIIQILISATSEEIIKFASSKISKRWKIESWIVFGLIEWLLRSWWYIPYYILIHWVLWKLMKRSLIISIFAHFLYNYLIFYFIIK